MKRPNSSDSLAGMGMFPMYTSSHDEEEEEDLCSHGVTYPSGSSEKKRRLSSEQVKALEKSFEVENKLEPERKARLAMELGLQPRQVAIWFQNRRARWKTKQLERDYGVLKANFDALKLSHDALRHDREALLSEINELKAKLEEGDESAIKEEKVEAVEVPEIKIEDEGEEDEPLGIESDSSDVLNDETMSFSSGFHSEELFRDFNCPSSSLPWQCSGSKDSRFGFQYLAQQQFRVEEEPYCEGFFSDEQPSPLPWYRSDHWSS